MVCADFNDYLACEARAAEAFRNTLDWQRRALMNIAGASRFYSDATIRQYASEIWNLRPVKTNFALLHK
jgi:starch phosphorylase